jgi:hypothetical protein
LLQLFAVPINEKIIERKSNPSEVTTLQSNNPKEKKPYPTNFDTNALNLGDLTAPLRPL